MVFRLSSTLDSTLSPSVKHGLNSDIAGAPLPDLRQNVGGTGLKKTASASDGGNTHLCFIAGDPMGSAIHEKLKGLPAGIYIPQFRRTAQQVEKLLALFFCLECRESFHERDHLSYCPSTSARIVVLGQYIVSSDPIHSLRAFESTPCKKESFQFLHNRADSSHFFTTLLREPCAGLMSQGFGDGNPHCRAGGTAQRVRDPSRSVAPVAQSTQEGTAGTRSLNT